METNHTPSDLEKEVLSKLMLPPAAPKEEVWEQLQGLLHATAPPSKRKPLLYWAVAASLAAALIGGFLRFYQTTVYCPAGTTLSQILPDGSEVQLNAGSSISYTPYWWKGNRTLQLEGEAFFKVKKGSKFQVQSEQGKTEVLGTSFNIYARAEDYVVACQTGKVLVTSPYQDSVYLLPQEKAIWRNQRLEKEPQHPQEMAWRRQAFSFDNVALSKVIKELERQYAIEITLAPNLVKKYQYTGYFKKTKEPKTALEIISISLGLQFKQTAPQQYMLFQ